MGKTKTAFVSDVTEKKPSYDKAAKAAKREAKKAEVTTEPVIEEVKSAEKKQRVRGKKYNAIKSKIDKNKLYTAEEAIKLVKETSYSKFDGTVELHLVVKKTGLSVNVTLPNPFGKAKKVEVASEATIEELKKGKINFDVLLSTAEMMPKLVPFAKLLGPRGMMPNPKNGTLIKDIKDAAKFSTAAISIKTEKEHPVIHTTVGKISQEGAKILANLNMVLDTLTRTQIIKAYLKPTMGPSVKLAI